MRRVWFQKLIGLLLFIFVGYNLVFARSTAKVTSSGNPLIGVSELKQLLEDRKVKLLDATYSIKKHIPGWREFRTEYYGKFDKLSKDFAEEEYEREHIHGAVSFSLDVGLYVGEFKRYALYPPGIFEQYVRKLGINNGDHVVVYGRGPFAGMLFASHVWWLLKYYGIDNVHVLNGGIEAWKKAGYPVESGKVDVQEGNFKSVINPDHAITFEELEAKDEDRSALIDRLQSINFFDGRPRDQYSGDAPQHYESKGQLNGFHIKGAKSLPAIELVNDSGLKSPNELRRMLENAGYVSGKPTITYCAVGNQGSLALLALTSLGINDAKLYQGGMTEVAKRDPGKI